MGLGSHLLPKQRRILNYSYRTRQGKQESGLGVQVATVPEVLDLWRLIKCFEVSQQQLRQGIFGIVVSTTEAVVQTLRDISNSASNILAQRASCSKYSLELTPIELCQMPPQPVPGRGVY